MKRKLKLWEKLLLAIGIILGIFALNILYYLWTALTAPEEEKCIPTEEQIDILYNSGSWGTDIEDMMENGMDATTRAYVETAQMMMKHLEEKYGVPFMACGGNGGPGLLGTGGYEATMYALEGDHAYEEFEARYGVDSEGEVYYEDQYYLKVHAVDVEKDFQKILEDAGLDIKATVWLNGYVEDIEGRELYEMLREYWVEINLTGFMRPDVTEDEFNRQAAAVTRLMEKRDEDIQITIFRLKSNERFDMIHTRSDLSNEKIWPRKREELYDLRYHDYVVRKRRG